MAHPVPLLDPPDHPVRSLEPPIPGAIPVYYLDDIAWWMHPETFKAIEEECEPLTEAEVVARAHQWANEADTPVKCYFIGGSEGPVKIGMSIDPNKRLQTLQLSSPVRLSILALTSGGAERESAYHYQFADFRLHGEWFERCLEIEEEIARLNAQSGPKP